MIGQNRMIYASWILLDRRDSHARALSPRLALRCSLRDRYNWPTGFHTTCNIVASRYGMYGYTHRLSDNVYINELYTHTWKASCLSISMPEVEPYSLDQMVSLNAHFPRFAFGQILSHRPDSRINYARCNSQLAKL